MKIHSASVTAATKVLISHRNLTKLKEIKHVLLFVAQSRGCLVHLMSHFMSHVMSNVMNHVMSYMINHVMSHVIELHGELSTHSLIVHVIVPTTMLAKTGAKS